jgi:hypothetical protein
MGASSRASPAPPSWTCGSKWWPVPEAACPILTPLPPDCGSGNHAHPAPTRFLNQIAASRGYSGTSRTTERPIWPPHIAAATSGISRSFQVEEQSNAVRSQSRHSKPATRPDGRRLLCCRRDSCHSLQRHIGDGVRTKRFFAAGDRARPPICPDRPSPAARARFAARRLARGRHDSAAAGAGAKHASRRVA